MKKMRLPVVVGVAGLAFIALCATLATRHPQVRSRPIVRVHPTSPTPVATTRILGPRTDATPQATPQKETKSQPPTQPPSSTDPLFRKLLDPGTSVETFRSHVRVGMAIYANEISPESLLDAIESLTSNQSDPQSRIKGLVLMAASGGSDLAQRWLKLMRAEADPSVRQAVMKDLPLAVTASGETPFADAIRQFALTESDPQVRETALNALPTESAASNDRTPHNVFAQLAQANPEHHGFTRVDATFDFTNAAPSNP